jgi:hypothetical protein
METQRRHEQSVTPTSPPWAARLPRSDAQAVALLRLAPGVRGCIVGQEIWLQGDSLDDAIQNLLRKLAPIQTFAVNNDRELIPLEHLLPVGRLPDGPWLPIDQLITVGHPTAALNGVSDSRVRIRLVRDDGERPATLLLTERATWAAYAETAPGVRLKLLRFAASANHVLIRGQPLPPLNGKHFYERSGLIVPCGYAWWPGVDPETLRRCLSLQADDLALLLEAGSWQLLVEACFVQARRSAIRLTMRATAGATT